MASFGPGSDPDRDVEDGDEWEIAYRLRAAARRPPVGDDGRRVWAVHCRDCDIDTPDEGGWTRTEAERLAREFDKTEPCGPHTVVPVPADPMVVVGLELPEGES